MPPHPWTPSPRPPLLRVACAVALAGLAVGVGCAGPGKKDDAPPPPHVTAKSAVADLSAPPAGYPDSDKQLADALGELAVARGLPPQAVPAKPLNVLALSGGGQYGAFVSGVLVGWTAAGTRPEFDVCTGISSGALIAMFAFLGPKYDPYLTRFATTLERKDVFDYRPVRGLIKDKALASSDPLKGLVEEVVSDEYLADLRAAHCAGRRLYIGTMYVRARRLVVWDVGALACSGRPDAAELVRKVILASSSIAGFVPPVEFDVTVNGVRYTEQHSDGGAVSQVFVRFGPDHPRYRPGGGTWLQGSNLYLIAGGKLYADPLPEKPGFFTLATSSISASLYALYRAELAKLHALCTLSGMTFNLVAIPQNLKTARKSLAFDPEAMKGLYAEGHALGVGGVPWRHAPTGANPSEQELPRAGLEFTVPVE
jgi:hypothetical protein